MTAPSLRAVLRGCPVTLAVAALAVAASGALFVGGAGARALVEPLMATASGLRAGEPWRLVTGPLIHGTPGHLLRDAVVFVVLGALAERRFGLGFAPWLAAALAVPAAAALLSQPDIAVYLGLSGAFHAQFVAVLVGEARARGGRLPSWGWLLAAGLVGKCAYEVVTGSLVMPFDLGPGVRPIAEAHLAGCAVGLAARWVPPRPGTCGRVAACRPLAGVRSCAHDAHPGTLSGAGGLPRPVGRPPGPGL